MKYGKKTASLLLAVVLVFTVLLGGCAGGTVTDIQNDGPADSVAEVQEGNTFYLKAASYNIKNCGNGSDVEKVADQIKAQDLDVVCVQEVDNQTERSGKRDILKLLSEASGLPYYHYYRAMDFQGGGYGIGVLSRYALSGCETIELETNKKDEPRILAKAEIKTAGGIVTIFNTHLSYESDTVRLAQITHLNQQLQGRKATLLMGDFNIQSFDEYSAITGLMPINAADSPMNSYRGDDADFLAIDNIFYSPGIRVISAFMVDSDASDHNMLVADVEIFME